MKKKIIITLCVLLLILTGFFGFRLISGKSTNDFSKGVLAVNINKTKYLKGEIVKIQITAVDANGKIECNANLKLTINGTEAKNIAKSSTCGTTAQNFDYSFNFEPEKTGVYRLKLTNTDTKVTITNSFDVVSERNLDIVRETATRIDPLKKDRNSMKLVVTVVKDYSGEISDIFPKGFAIPWQGPAKITGNKIFWQVNLKAGETKELTYEYSAPKVVPALYKFGENGEWIVVAANTQESKTVLPTLPKLK